MFHIHLKIQNHLKTFQIESMILILCLFINCMVTMLTMKYNVNIFLCQVRADKTVSCVQFTISYVSKLKELWQELYL